ncbi:MAG TPA: hypothetical protein VNI58_04230 [Mariprofundaceae bacterium]|nr:hypothetical protein [Mariprofundaceae bacterium]
MRKQQIGSIFFATLIALAISGEAMAWQFSFNVPVELKDINPKYTRAKVICRVVDSTNQEIGRFSPDIPLVNGAFSGKVSVPVTPIEGKSVADGTRYYCNIILCTSTDDATCAYASGIPNINQPGTPFTPETHADIQ